MPSAVSPGHQATSAADDDIDNLFNYDDAVDDFLKDLPTNNGSDEQNNNTASNSRRDRDASNDMDEEIKVTRKRAPAPKLDDNRYVTIHDLHSQA